MEGRVLCKSHYLEIIEGKPIFYCRYVDLPTGRPIGRPVGPTGQWQTSDPTYGPTSEKINIRPLNSYWLGEIFLTNLISANCNGIKMTYSLSKLKSCHFI